MKTNNGGDETEVHRKIAIPCQQDYNAQDQAYYHKQMIRVYIILRIAQQVVN